MELPQEKSIPKERLQDYSILITGEKKIGKTSCLSHFPNTLFLMCEPGDKALSIYKIDIKGWEDFTSAIKALKKDKKFDTVVVDTADQAYRLCFDYVCDIRGIEHPEEEGHGKGWAAIRTEFTKWIMKLLSLGKGVVFTSHSKYTTIKTRQKEEDLIVSTMPGQAKDVIEPLVDIWIYAGFGDNKERVFTIRGDANITAGHRLQNHFVGIETISMGTNAKEAYENFIEAFNTTEDDSKKEKRNEGNKKVRIRIKR